MAARAEAYERVRQLIAEDEAVILDGGNATELDREQAGHLRDSDKGLWGTWALPTLPTRCSTSTAATSRPAATSSPRTRGPSWPRPSSRPAGSSGRAG